MSVLVTEPHAYSPSALAVYNTVGPLLLGQATAREQEHVRLLVIRLAQRVDAAYLARFPSLEAIATPTTGLTHVDLQACRERGVRVYSLADCREAIEAVTSTAELAFGLLLALLRAIPAAHQSVVVEGQWDRERFRSRQLSRLTLGLVGLGRIGGHMARYAERFGMHVLACDPFQPEERFRLHGAERRDLESLLAEADVVSLHANLSEESRGLIGAGQVAAMRRGALFINTARGELTDEQALADGLRRGSIAGVAADVLAGEHAAGGWSASPLLQAAQEGLNVILTPHIGGCTTDAMHITEEALAEVVAAAMARPDPG